MIAARLLLFILAFATYSHAAPLKTVKVDLIEALANRDTTSSDRFREDFEKTLCAGTQALQAKLNSCGYTLQTRTLFFEASDALKAKELATQSQAEETWLIIGPRRSNHYLLLAQGSPETPTVSLIMKEEDWRFSI